MPDDKKHVSLSDQISGQSMPPDVISTPELHRSPGKKFLIKAAALTVLVFCMVFVLIHLDAHKGGNVSQVETSDVDSQLFSSEDIDSAMKTIIKEFEENWKGCKLTRLWYAGDETSIQESEERDVQTIVLLSDFETSKPPAESALNENHTYTNWNWILIRSSDGKWVHIDHGYG